MALEFFIGAGAVQKYPLIGSTEIVLNINGRSTATFKLWDPTGAYLPDLDYDVEITDIHGTVFKGLVVGLDEDWLNHGNGKVWTFDCADYSSYADRRVIRASAPSVPVARDAIDYIVDNYLSVYGVTRDPLMPTGGALGAQSFDLVKASEVLDSIVAQADTAGDGWLWRIDENKVLKAFLPAIGQWACTFDLLDENLIGDLKIRRLREGYFNKLVYIAGRDTDTEDEVTVFSENASEISAHGIYEVGMHNQSPMAEATAQAIADSLVSIHSRTPYEYEWTTRSVGARAGMTIPLDCSRVSGVDALIQEVRMWDVLGGDDADDGSDVFCTIKAVAGAARKDHWKQTYKLWARSGVQVVGGPSDPVTVFNAGRVQSTGKFRTTSATSIAGSFGSLPEVGHLILVGVQGTGLANWTAGDVTDNQGHTYDLAVATPVGGAVDSAIFYTVVTASSGTFTVTVNPAGLGATSMTASAVEYRGNWNQATALDRTATNNAASGTTITTGTTSSTTEPIEVIAIIFGTNANQSSITVQTSPAWTEEHEELGAGGFNAGEFDTRVTSVVGTQAGQWTVPTTSGWAAAIATFKEDVV